MWWHDEELPEDENRERTLSFPEMVRRVAPLFRPHRRALAVGVTLMLLSVGAELAGPVVLWRLFDDAIPSGSRSGIVGGGALFALFFLVGVAATYLQIVVVTRMGLAIVTALKERLFDHLLHLSLAYFDRHPPGVLLARVESDAERLQALFSEVSVSVVRTLVMIAGAFAVMLFASWRVTLIMLALVVPLGVLTWFFFRWLRPLFRRVRHAYAAISGFVAEYVQGVPILQAFGYERRALERLRDLNRTKVRLEFRASLLEYGFWGLLNSMEVVAVMLILAVAGLDLLPGIVLSAGLVVLFVDLTRRLFWPLAMFSEQLNFIQRAFASADRVFDVLDTPSRTPDRPGARTTVDDDWRELRFEDVSFTYDGGTRALDGVSFPLRRGEKVALVGLSGGGKTTITNLLLRFHEPTGGRITLDGTDLRDIAQKAWRRRIGLVLQDIHLFPGTVGENLRALLDDVGPDALGRALDTVGARAVVERLPGGLDAPLSEGGANLSMGERQLLSFARAIVRDPDLLVLDEATSSVDPGTERALQESLDRLLRGRTALIIAHRLATVVHADRILVVHQGRIAEQGSHEELYRADGIYRDLFDLQFREGEAA